MNLIHPNRAGLAVGALLMLWHAAWAFMVLVGVAQPFMDFIFRLHMITPAFKVEEFYIGRALCLLVVSGALGYLSGLVLAAVWNRIRVRSA